MSKRLFISGRLLAVVAVVQQIMATKQCAELLRSANNESFQSMRVIEDHGWPFRCMFILHCLYILYNRHKYKQVWLCSRF